ncbi:MAG: hypothetical protein D6754_02805 [Alphaproteobacteria bacterium]|nr:MAG: hypothetical protein D6754_02805 [Alphaproteobacteria bacterium]
MERQSLLVLSLLRLAVVAVSALCLLLSLAPAGLAPAALPMPDLVTLVLLGWMIRRPEAVPLPLLLAVSLGAELLRGAPLGIGTLCLLAAAELMDRLRGWLGRNGFLAEWLLAALIVTAMSLMQCLALWISFGPLPPAMAVLSYTALTAALYPAVLFIQRLVLPLHAPPLVEVGF